MEKIRLLLSRYYNRITILLIIILCLAIYRKVGSLGFVFDDNVAIVRNSFVHKGIEGIPDLLTTTLWRGDTTRTKAIEAYRPLTMISFAINHELFGLDSASFHWTQLAIYIVLCIFSYLTLQELLGQERKHIALLATVIFAVHPVHTEVVCNLKSRDELLSLFFAVLALYNVARHINTGKIKYRLYAALLYPLGLFSKESAVVFLGIIPLTYYFFSSLRIAEIIKNTIPFLIGFTIFMIARHMVLSSETQQWVAITEAQNPLLLIETWSQKWGTILYINGKYLQLMIFPYQLTFSYFHADIPFIDIWHWKALLTLFAYGLIGFYIYNNFKSKDIGAYGLLCYLAGLSIFSHTIPIIPFSNAMGERLAFTMSWGWCLFAGYVVWKLLSTEKLQNALVLKTVRAFTIILTASVLIFFVYKSHARVPAWESYIKLCMTDEEVSPKSFFINGNLFLHYYNLAIATRNPELISKAEKYVNNILYLGLDEYDPVRWIRKGHLALLKGNYAQADSCFDKGLYFASFEERSPVNTEYVEQYWQEAKQYNVKLWYPSLGYAYKHIGEIFFDVKNYPRALACFEAALPYMQSKIGKFYTYRDIGASLLMLKKYEKSIEYLNKADSIYQGDYYVYNGLGNAYFRLKDYEQANRYFEKAFDKYKTGELINNLIAVNKLLGDSTKVAYYQSLVKKSNR